MEQAEPTALINLYNMDLALTKFPLPSPDDVGHSLIALPDRDGAGAFLRFNPE
jgi:hypothetical protein